MFSIHVKKINENMGSWSKICQFKHVLNVDKLQNSLILRNLKMKRHICTDEMNPSIKLYTYDVALHNCFLIALDLYHTCCRVKVTWILNSMVRTPHDGTSVEIIFIIYIIFIWVYLKYWISI